MKYFQSKVLIYCSFCIYLNLFACMVWVDKECIIDFRNASLHLLEKMISRTQEILRQKSALIGRTN